MLDDARTLLAEEGMEEEEQLKFIEELTAELEGKELQERGATLVDILEELQAPREGIDDIGDDYGGGARPMEGDDDAVGSYEARAPPPYELSLIHISEPTRLGMSSYAVFCLKK